MQPSRVTKTPEPSDCDLRDCGRIRPRKNCRKNGSFVSGFGTVTVRLVKTLTTAGVTAFASFEIASSVFWRTSVSLASMRGVRLGLKSVLDGAPFLTACGAFSGTGIVPDRNQRWMTRAPAMKPTITEATVFSAWDFFAGSVVMA